MTARVPGIVVAAALLSCLPGGASRSLGADEGGSPVPRLSVRAVWPRPGDESVVTDPVAVRFSRAVEIASVDAGSFRVTGPGGVEVPGSWGSGVGPDGSEDLRTVVFTPSAPLRPGWGYEVLLGRAIRSVPGGALREPVLIRFAADPAKPAEVFTGLGPEHRLRRFRWRSPAPRVDWTFPRTGLSSVYTDEVVVRFTQPMDPEVPGTRAMELWIGEARVPGTLASDDESGPRVLRFTPSQPLFRAASYEIRVSDDARSVRGRYMRREFRAGFRTSPFKDAIRGLGEEDFRATQAVLATGRAHHTATELPGGDVLIAGGQDFGGAPLAGVEIYRVATGTFETLGPLGQARRKHAAALTADGSVLLCGGFGETGVALSSVEIYDPATGTSRAAPTMGEARANHTATVLGTRILVAGGFKGPASAPAWCTTAEIFRSSTGDWIPTAGSPSFVRGGHTATRLQDGRVFLAGGTPAGVLENEIFIPATDSFIPTTPGLGNRAFHAACLLGDGRVLLAGGGPPLAETYSPALDSHREAGTWVPGGLPTSTSPLYATVTPLPSGRVAVLGGFVPGGGGGGAGFVSAGVLLWDPGGAGGTGVFVEMPFSLDIPRAAHTISRLPSGTYLLVGGLGTDGVSNERRATIFSPSQ